MNIHCQELPLEKNKVITEIDSIVRVSNKKELFSKLLRVIDKYRKSGDYISTIIAINKTNEHYNGIKNPRTSSALKTYLGQAYNGLGLYSESINHASKALMIAKESNNLDVEISSLMILSEAYSGLKLFDKGKSLMLKAYKISATTDDIQTKKLVLGNLISAFLDNKKLDSSFYFINKLEKLETNLNKPSTFIHLHKASYFFQKNKLDSAIYYSEKFQKELNYFKNPHTKVTLNILLSKIYLKKKDYKKALHYLNIALNHAKKYHYQEQLISIYDLLSEIYKDKDNLKYSYFKEKHYDLLDSLNTANMSNAIKNIKLIYNLRRKSANLEKLKLENKLKETKIKTLLVLLIGAIIFIIIIFILNKNLNNAYKKIVNDNIESIKDHEEKILLRKQIILDKKNINTIPIDNKINISQEQCNQIELSIRKLFDIEKVYLQKDLDLDKLAKIANTNRVYLSFVFNNVINIPFSEMLNKYRINEAKKLLILNSEKYTIEAIAKLSGYKNKATFNRNFKKITGITPTIFLKFYKENAN